MREPCRIKVIQDGKWHRIKGYDFTAKPGTPSEYNDDTSQRPKQTPMLPAESDVFDASFDF
ncbi:hypothetical protein NX722_11890 [Endozoicomonas gorgoniicola]|uniref:Uncharacterized protein n=1 Tax=Endozoicomonas gorgoniicola TaxID=1234144 RepID=A0ABT3MVB0_9GAMM|nr:hypothetical protein [Endozoicomonas gorgoniicola]MCW7553326.1 hypothetical protein [Endozoicomonas gorgoniicola]